MKLALTSVLCSLFVFLSAQDKKPEAGTQIYTITDEIPQFPGGMKAMAEFVITNLHYPDSAREAKLQGKCFTKFVIHEDGTVSDVMILKGVPNCKACDEEALRVIKLFPNWQPAKANGNYVSSYFNLPIVFHID